MSQKVELLAKLTIQQITFKKNESDLWKLDLFSQKKRKEKKPINDKFS